MTAILKTAAESAAEATTVDNLALGPLDGQMTIALVVCMAIACVIIFGLLIYKKMNK